MRALVHFLIDERGQTAIEYGLIAAVGAVAIIGSLQFMGESVTSMFDGLLVGFGRGEGGDN